MKFAFSGKLALSLALLLSAAASAEPMPLDEFSAGGYPSYANVAFPQNSILYQPAFDMPSFDDLSFPAYEEPLFANINLDTEEAAEIQQPDLGENTIAPEADTSEVSGENETVTPEAENTEASSEEPAVTPESATPETVTNEAVKASGEADKKDEKKKSKVRLKGLVSAETSGFETIGANPPFKKGYGYKSNISIEPSLVYTGPFDLEVGGRYDSSTGLIVLRDYYATFHTKSKYDIKVGQYKDAFGIAGSQAVSQIMTINQNAMTSALYHGRDIGINYGNLKDKKKDVTWSLGVVGGQGMNKSCKGHPNIVGRLKFKTGKHSHFGLSCQVGTYENANNIVFPVRRLGTDFQLKNKKLRLDAELAYSDGYNKTSKADTPALGGYVSAAFALSKQWDIVASADWFDPNLDVASPNYSTANNASARLVLGVNYWFKRDLPHRIMFNYENKFSTEGYKYNQDGWYFRYAYSF